MNKYRLKYACDKGGHELIVDDCPYCAIAELKEAAGAVVEEKERLSTYMGGPVAIDELNHRIKALAALLKKAR